MGTTETQREVRTYCRVCSAACGIIVTVDGEQVLRVSGDPDHPISQGYTCSKGRSLPAQHHDENRLDGPEMDGARIDWSTAINDLGDQLRAIVDAHGPDAVAIYRSGGWAFDALGKYLIDSFARGLDTSQVYSSITLDTPAKLLVPNLVAGTPYLTPQPDRDHTDLMMLVGVNPVVSHGHAFMWPTALADLRAQRARGGHLVVVDPRRTETAALADVHVPLQPGTDAAFLAHLIREVLAEGADDEYLQQCASAESLETLRRCVEPYDRATTASRCGIDEDILTTVVDLLRTTRRSATICGTGTSMAAASNVSEWFAWALNAVTGSLDRPGGVLFNPGFLRPQETGVDARSRFSGPSAQSRPDLRHSFGELPCVALADEILDGRVKALVVLGGNPAKVFPDTVKIDGALRSLQVLATIEVRHTETTELSTHVLACAGQLERADLPGFIDTAYPRAFTQYGARVVPPAAERRPTWWILSQLGQRMGLRMPEMPEDGNEDTLLARGVRRSRVRFEELRNYPSGLEATDAPEPGWLIPSALPSGLLDLAPAEFVEQLEAWQREPVSTNGLRLVNRRLPHQMNSQLREIRSQQRPPAPTLLVNRIDAEHLGLTDGATVLVRSRHGETTATVERSETIRPGVVSLPHAWGSPDVNMLTSDVDDVDTLTGMPRFSGLEVTVQLASG